MEDHSIEDQEKQRLLLLHRGIIKARWLFFAVFLFYGLSLAVLTRVLGHPAFSTVEGLRPIASQFSSFFLIAYNFVFWLYLKKKGKDLNLKGLKRFSFFQIGVDLVYFSFVFHTSGGVEGPGMLMYILPLVVASILFSPKGVVITSALIVLFSLGVTYVDYIGLIRHFELYIPSIGSRIYEDSYALFFSLFALTATIISVAVFFALSSRVMRRIERFLRERTQELQIERNKIEAVVANLIDGIILLDKNEKIALINPEASSILGSKKKNLYGKKIEEIKDLPHLTKIYELLDKKVEWTGQKYEIVFGEPLARHFQIITSPVVTKDNQKIGVMIILHDVTREKEIEHLKTEFVSIAAHQLRTPLSAIKWTIKMALDGDAGQLSKEQSELLQGGYQSNERMIHLVNDLLNVARIEEGRLVYDMSSVALEELVEIVIEQSKPISDQKNIKIEFIKPKEILPEVEADKEKVQLVVQNLIENAIKYTDPNKEVTISLKSDKINLELMVRDSGIGIPADQQERVFSKFFRADNAMKKGAEGTGMGLFISKSIIEKHGGRIWFESEEGKSTTFWFSLPIKSIKK